MNRGAVRYVFFVQHAKSHEAFEEGGYDLFAPFINKPSTEGLEFRLKHPFDWYKTEENLRKK